MKLTDTHFTGQLPTIQRLYFDNITPLLEAYAGGNVDLMDTQNTHACNILSMSRTERKREGDQSERGLQHNTQ